MHLDRIKREREREGETIGHHVFRIFIESNDKSLNWLNDKLRFGGGSRFMELPVFTLLFFLLRTNELKF